MWTIKDGINKFDMNLLSFEVLRALIISKLNSQTPFSKMLHSLKLRNVSTQMPTSTEEKQKTKRVHMYPPAHVSKNKNRLLKNMSLK